MYYVIFQYVILYHDRYSASFLHVCCIAFDTVYPNDIHIIRYGFVSVLETIRARETEKYCFCANEHFGERENNEPVMLFFPSKLTTLCEQAPEGLWACSRGVVSRLIWGVEQARLECWAGAFGMLSLFVLNVEFVSLASLNLITLTFFWRRKTAAAWIFSVEQNPHVQAHVCTAVF